MKDCSAVAAEAAMAFATRNMRKEKPMGKTKLAMVKACTTLAEFEDPRGAYGMPAGTCDEQLKTIGTWMKYFVPYMVGNPNRSRWGSVRVSVNGVLVPLSQVARWKQYSDDDNRVLVVWPNKREQFFDVTAGLSRAGIKYTFLNMDDPYEGIRVEAPLFNRAEAILLAQNIFKGILDGEVRAKLASTLDPYWTRDAGPVEWGHSFSDEEYMPRQYAEACTGPEYLREEDEHAVEWTMGDFDPENNDEVVSASDGDQLYEIPAGGAESAQWLREKVAELVEDLKINFQGRGITVIRARNLAMMKLISWRDAIYIKDLAEMVLPKQEGRIAEVDY